MTAPNAADIFVYVIRNFSRILNNVLLSDGPHLPCAARKLFFRN